MFSRPFTPLSPGLVLQSCGSSVRLPPAVTVPRSAGLGPAVPAWRTFAGLTGSSPLTRSRTVVLASVALPWLPQSRLLLQLLRQLTLGSLPDTLSPPYGGFSLCCTFGRTYLFKLYSAVLFGVTLGFASLLPLQALTNYNATQACDSTRLTHTLVSVRGFAGTSKYCVDRRYL